MRTSLLPLVTLVAVAAACAGGNGDLAPVATPTLTLSTSVAPIGSPLEMSYRFAMASDAPALSDDHWVFVHFLDTDGELMWTDDHEPPTPVSEWRPGSTIEYQRTMFIPKFPYVGETRVEIGLFSRTTGARLPMVGETLGQRAYTVASFEMTLQSDNLFVVFQDGWHPMEVSDEGVEWHWSGKDATLTFANPQRDVRVYLSVDQPSTALAEPQQVEVRVGPAVIDSFTLATGERELRRIQVSRSQLGTDEMVEMVISVDKTFVPASVPQLGNPDARELGIRVFRAFVQPL